MNSYKVYFLFLFVVVIHSGVAAQRFNGHPPYVNFIGDSLVPHRQQTRDSVIDSVFHLKKDYDFQFRFWQEGMSNLSINVFILTLRKGRWEARDFQFTGNGKDRKKYTWKNNPYYIEKKVDQDSLDVLWDKLVRNSILTLPTEKSLKKQENFFEIDTALLATEGSVYHTYGLVWIDGLEYSFELFSPKQSRYYEYGSPFLELKKYPYIEEFYKVAGIILLIKKRLGHSYFETLSKERYYSPENKFVDP